MRKTTRKKKPPLVAVVMGSASDKSIMQGAVSALKEAKIPHEVHV
ncbi:MAG: 5-(carboxyamino)imidazole ribonucleotide mutase, partial [Armatimonadetes bacterium]|nr:5-(carboxyamino)imidazole ribonucleotide mutase [Armatimonadota bacterium]NIM22886.1 5-(carboxyamino)imidazole ribonucleotide mutase [Armatimonadota bacterium]NIM66753.1 5-(carboxyamino)imidazole ribonucleotide mutase [Armatimonadota bacterium]NIM75300.1 5-(carboxyamino)imidazole ribonucleotide mutase [Armatimonadota bacterium]NIN04949.1 5-(carboxyamino)imidazole ribonucleotide mutase [Armatimonadota bacterium]